MICPNSRFTSKKCFLCPSFFNHHKEMFASNSKGEGVGHLLLWGSRWEDRRRQPTGRSTARFSNKNRWIATMGPKRRWHGVRPAWEIGPTHARWPGGHGESPWSIQISTPRQAWNPSGQKLAKVQNKVARKQSKEDTTAQMQKEG